MEQGEFKTVDTCQQNLGTDLLKLSTLGRRKNESTDLKPQKK